jgi:hypothetical protein
MDTQRTFFNNNKNDHFSIIPKTNTYGFLTKNGLHQKSKNVIYGKKTYVGQVYEPLVDDQWPHYP